MEFEGVVFEENSPVKLKDGLKLSGGL